MSGKIISTPLPRRRGVADFYAALASALGVDRVTAKHIALRSFYGDPNAKVLVAVSGVSI